jgi:hypothetical protein
VGVAEQNLIGMTISDPSSSHVRRYRMARAFLSSGFRVASYEFLERVRTISGRCISSANRAICNFFFRTSRIGLTSVDYLVHRSCNHFTHLIEKCHNKNLNMVQLCRLALLAFVGVVQGQDRNLDRFNYDTTVRTDTYIDFGPEDWGDIRCPDLETCVSNPE